jgi:hypothetical protein
MSLRPRAALKGVSEQTTSSLGSRLTDAGQQPLHNLPVGIATGRDSLHRLLSEELGLLFGLSFIFRKRHLLADNFLPRLLFRLHISKSLDLKRGQAYLKRPSSKEPERGVLISLHLH